MKRLSFLQKHVEPILAGVKTHTTRLELEQTSRGRLYAPRLKPDEIIALITGPRMRPKVFGHAVITGVIAPARFSIQYDRHILRKEGYPNDTCWEFCKRVMRLSGHNDEPQQAMAYATGQFDDDRGRTRWVVLYRFRLTEAP